MVHSDFLKTKAIDRLNTIVTESDLSYDILMSHLKYKIQEWNTEMSGLSGLNPFDLTNEECDRKNYLEWNTEMSGLSGLNPFDLTNEECDRKNYLVHMISYGNELVSNYNKMDDSTLFAIERERKINRILS
jgi:hypothetical protein